MRPDEEPIRRISLRVSFAKSALDRGLQHFGLVPRAVFSNATINRPSINVKVFCQTKEATFAFRLILWAASCRGNIDSLMINVARWARQHGHSSMVLNLLKIPLVPDP